jgi:hypothetical protein
MLSCKMNWFGFYRLAMAKSLAALAGFGSITRIKPTLEPFKLTLVKTELEGRVDRWLLSRV